jgi:CRISPR/Cas system CMR-associated protein Cmr5 small subunit
MTGQQKRWTIIPIREAELCLDDAAESVRFGVYLSLARQLPHILHQHGLGQTLAYLQMRGGDRTQSPFHLVLEHLNHWLAMTLGLPEEDVLSSLTQFDSDVYLRAMEEARRLLLALRTAAEDEIAAQQAAREQQS